MKKILLAFLLCGCNNHKDVPVIPLAVPAPKAEVSSERFFVQMVSTFNDSVAYGGERAIYIIIDRQSGKEFIGISGIGISELGSHTVSSGKSSYIVPDER